MVQRAIIVDCGSRHISDLHKLLGEQVEVAVLPESALVQKIDADMVVISGASHVPSVYYEPERHQVIIDFIKNSDIPILGVCFGCELIARAFDCMLYDSGEKITGMHEICMNDGSRFCFQAYEAHRFGIQSVSPDMEILARGNDGSIEIIRHKTKRILGTQFHPERTEGGEVLFDLMTKILLT